MKTPRKNNFLMSLAAAAMGVLAASTMQGQITWGPATTVADDTDVSTDGTAVFAYDWNNSVQTVNGVKFTAPGSGAVISGGLNGNYGGFLTGTGAPATTLSTAYQNILTGGEYDGGANPDTVTLKNLVFGDQYEVQIWADDSRSCCDTRSVMVTNADGNGVTLEYNTLQALGGLGQYTIGMFTAYGPTEIIGLQGAPSSGSTQINALQLRNLGLGSVAVPPLFSEPSGNYLGVQTVTLSGERGATVFYTTDGTTPKNTSPNGGIGAGSAIVTIPVSKTVTVNAFETNAAQTASAVVTATYTTFATPAVPTWINRAGGSWAAGADWSNNVVAQGSGITADFSQLTLASNLTVTLDSSPTIGNLIFSDVGNTYTWEIDAGTGGTLTLDSGANLPTITVKNQPATITSPLAGTNGVTKNGTGTLTFSGTGISFTGTSTVNSGTLNFLDNGNGNGNAPLTAVLLSGNNSALTFTSSGGTSDFRGGVGGTGTITINASTANVRFGPWGSVTQITNTSGDVVVASGELQVAGRSNYRMFNIPGNLVVTNGSVVSWNALNDLSPGTGSIFGALIGDGTLSGDYSTPYATFGNSNASGVFSGVIQNALSITKIGSGTQVFSGLNTYTGSTTVSNGTLEIDGSLAAGSVVTVEAGATLDGIGTIGGRVTVNAGGTLAAGTSSAVGQLTLGNTLMLNAGSATMLRIDKAAATNDSVAGAIIYYNGALTVTNLGGTLAPGDTFQLFSAIAVQGEFDALTLPPLPAGLSWNVSQLTANGSITVASGAAVPAFNPPAGGYMLAETVAISSLTPGATIYYTTDGSAPSTGSAHGASGVTVAVPLNATMTIKAFAVAAGYANSAVNSATYETSTRTVWTDLAGGSWSNPNNWTNGTVANSPGGAADFSTLTLSSNTIVTLDGQWTIGNLIFGDVGNTYAWEIDSGTGGPLALASGTNTPAITVNNQTATITALIVGTNGLTETGNGTLALTAENTYTGGTTVNAGTLFADAGNTDAGAVGYGNVTVNTGGTITVGGDNSFVGGARLQSLKTNTITINAGGTITNASSSTCHLHALVLNGGTLAANSANVSYGNWNLDYGVSTPGNGRSSFMAGGNAALSQIGGTVFNIGSNDILIVSTTFEHTAGASDYGLIKTGSGTLTLNGANTSTAGEFVNGGTLDGNGQINGPMTVNAGGTLAAGTPSAIGQLTIENTPLTLNAGSTTMLRLNNATSTYDSLTGISTLVYGGTLRVTNLAGTLAAGNNFTLFSATTYSGGFSNYILPSLAAGLSWDVTKLNANGSIAVVSGAAPLVFNPPAGSYILGAQTVTITCLNPGATIYYTTDGSTPSTSSSSGITPVTVTVPVNATRTIQAYGHATGFTDTPVASATYTTELGAVWINLSGGSWGTASDWTNGIIPNQSGGTADFSTLTLTTNTDVTLDGTWTIGNLIFGDVGNKYTWEIDPGTGTSLTLAAGTNMPNITVKNQMATITSAIAGVNGLAKAGPGTLTLTANNTFTGGTVVNSGTLALTTQNSAFNDSQLLGALTMNSGTILALTNLPFGYGGGLSTLNLNGATIVGTGGLGSFAIVYNLTGAAINATTRFDLATYNGADGAINSLASSTTSVISSNISEIFFRGDSGQSNFTFTTAAGTTPSGVDLDLQTGIAQYSAVCTVIKAGAGVMSLDATNIPSISGSVPYTGPTIVSNGTLLVNGSLSGSSAVSVLAGAKLGGNGTVSSPTTVQSGGTLEAGGISAIGQLTLSNTLTLNAGSTTMARINPAAAANDSVAGITTLTYGGTLTVTSLGGTLAAGDSFKLFSAATCAGDFTATNLPALGSGLAWAWTPATGTLAVVTTANVPVLTGIAKLSPTSFSLSFTGENGLGYTILMTTNLAVPSADWTHLTSGTFGAGPVDFTDTGATNAARFYRIVSP